MKSETSVREGLRKLPIRPIYLVSCEHDGKKNIISVGMFAYFSGKPLLVGIGIAPSRARIGTRLQMMIFPANPLFYSRKHNAHYLLSPRL